MKICFRVQEVYGEHCHGFGLTSSILMFLDFVDMVKLEGALWRRGFQLHVVGCVLISIKCILLYMINMDYREWMYRRMRSGHLNPENIAGGLLPYYENWTVHGEPYVTDILVGPSLGGISHLTTMNRAEELIFRSYPKSKSMMMDDTTLSQGGLPTN
ncbi:hypothetical protein SADUNF_Sadunf13G0076700 [Salix dunnii]|uniref:Uncharacterized protein n=1 Tax=Salix dunnii TaxID=1413687 RepID=A0A835JIV3_9ROSI|nr:hypothetical protein SADUNF_Sadunf13G0076700 [Salix dunnii]